MDDVVFEREFVDDEVDVLERYQHRYVELYVRHQLLLWDVLHVRYMDDS